MIRAGPGLPGEGLAWLRAGAPRLAGPSAPPAKPGASGSGGPGPRGLRGARPGRPSRGLAVLAWQRQAWVFACPGLASARRASAVPGGAGRFLLPGAASPGLARGSAALGDPRRAGAAGGRPGLASRGRTSPGRVKHFWYRCLFVFCVSFKVLSEFSRRSDSRTLFFLRKRIGGGRYPTNSCPLKIKKKRKHQNRPWRRL